ncbi:MAG: phage protein Gp27 family protein [Kluyvera sp.]|uniref:phage protein Gp27 family protein n=1 Tax=Kluyvera sp. TaxID=1538228 RepID=UPI003A8B5CAD
MGRRSKVDMFGLVERVLGLYQRDKKTIKEIAAVLKEDGFDVSFSAIQRTLKSNQEIALQMRKAAEETKILLAEVKDNPGTDLVEVSQQIMANKLLEVIKSVDDLQFEKASDLVEALASLSRAQVNTGRLRLEFTAGVTAAKSAIEDKLTELLQGNYPELLRQLLDALDQIEITKQDITRAKKSVQ